MGNVKSVADTTVGSGTYNKRIVIQQLLDVPDGQGGTDRTWVPILTTWARIKSYHGMETWKAGQVQSVFWKRVWIRYRPTLNINDTMRLLYGTRLYNIRSVDVIEEAQTNMELLCEELQATGSLH